MDKKIIDLASLSVGEDGKVVLSDPVLEKLAGELDISTAAAGTNNMGCDNTANNRGCTNHFSCSGSINTSVCSNTGYCDGTNNTVKCSQPPDPQ